MTRSEFLVEFDKVLELPPGTLTGSEPLEDLASWDSLAMIGFMALADEHYQTKLSPRQFVNCTTVNDLLELARVQS